jgi:nucleoside-diphosphate-sugar epimerase
VYALDISRLRDDTGFAPGFTLRTGLPDYLAWLGAGSPY